MKPCTATSCRRSLRGFSLVELMVGMLMALIAVLVMMQALLNTEERGRSATADNEALSNGAVMLHLVARDLVQAGYGLNALRLLGCALTLPSGAVIPLVPVAINPPSTVLPSRDANTDSLLLMYGSSESQPEGNPVAAVAGGRYTVQAPSSFATGDFVIAAPDSCPAPLTLAQVTAVNATQVTVDTVEPAATALYNLGKSPRIVGYRVHDGSLVSCDLLRRDCRSQSVDWAPVSANMPSLRAVYGRDTAAPAMDGAADTWDQATPTTACGWARTLAVRVALVARNSHYESFIDPATRRRSCEAVTTTATPPWEGSVAAPITLPGTDWQCHRHKLFETLVPTRNVIWMEAQAGC